MRKWQDQAVDDPNSYFDVAGVQPTPYGTYETHSALTTFGASSTAGQPIYAFKGQGVSRVAEYVVTTTKILDASLVDRTGGVAIGTYPFMVQYGDITICAMGNAVVTVNANAGNFAALAGAPKAEILVVQRNCVVAFNTDTASDGWAASDVGDYTNWTTGEAASGRIITTPGNVTAAVPFGNDIIVFKPSSIYRMTYVGGLIKWSIDLIWSGIGCTVQTGQVQNFAKYYAHQGLDTILFFGQGDSSIFSGGTKQTTSYAYLFDGASPPRPINPLTAVTEGVVLHDPSRDTFTVVPISSSVTTFNLAYFYNRRSDMWGKTVSGIVNTALTSTNVPIPIVGDFYIRQTKSPMPNWWGDNGGNLVKYTVSNSTLDILFTPYVETAKIGQDDQTTIFTRVTGKFLRKSGGLTGTGTHRFEALTVTTFLERYHIGNEPTSTTATITQSTATKRDRFDFSKEAFFARFKLSWQNFDAELSDVQITSKPGSKE